MNIACVRILDPNPIDPWLMHSFSEVLQLKKRKVGFDRYTEQVAMKVDQQTIKRNRD